jgi:hypothetical protein
MAAHYTQGFSEHQCRRHAGDNQLARMNHSRLANSALAAHLKMSIMTLSFLTNIGSNKTMSFASMKNGASM